MNCGVPYCQGDVEALDCSIHGDICAECRLPRWSGRPDNLCRRCGARADGETCGGCGSPWIYLTFHEDQKWRCKMCVNAIIDDRGYEESEEDLRAKVEERAALAESERTEREARARQELEEVRAKKAAKRMKTEQEENLFTLDKPKRKKK